VCVWRGGVGAAGFSQDFLWSFVLKSGHIVSSLSVLEFRLSFMYGHQQDKQARMGFHASRWGLNWAWDSCLPSWLDHSLALTPPSRTLLRCLDSAHHVCFHLETCRPTMTHWTHAHSSSRENSSGLWSLQPAGLKGGGWHCRAS
jgi:hypothetical protein